MVKFKSDLDRSLFCTEMERIDLIGQDTIPDDLHEIFLKNRKTLVSKVKDFRRSQIGKASWRRHRYSHLKGVRKWHKSTEGKKFHRQLGRFLATRITNRFESIDNTKYETLKALSSLRTHLFIEGEYYRSSMDEDVDFDFLLEYSLPHLASLEQKVHDGKYEDISYDELELLLRLVEQVEVLSALSTVVDFEPEELSSQLESQDVNEDLTYGMLVKYFKILEMKSNVDYLKSLMEIQDV
ncbi:hypothetical protein EVB32_356 [Rhizobium phage RHph_TM39]|uniref:Uncharacterized protein n=2 Tax=Cuauhnahuacvirus TaxID=3044696 RepID=A0A7S5UX12_9CAUD|nr:hypothetical protein PQC16_gp280 [Rhizobium phage RHph_TM30]YP_010671509.1 hypothetical protein PQC17_gp281 [Rhizobium phage RHph_Y65]QIG71831.1 hypothetical protein EVB94_380 [Rhizobium phage RHph_TM40]QIG72193.1 hypothetical protein EVB95_380 [Rhizobium phage RHph_TM2_3B]QIG72555.1 hypothetical protein EVB96_379 [Rhizobium phage RHph_TM3_3_6]QIG77324.1 hypothetical protein EVB32_356 [Rhizobium phage RHph_TM39]QIG77939.1 hypothetical protein EVB64_373 [Rhizobium phage RHph_TM61]